MTALLLPDETIKEDIITGNNSERLSSELQVTSVFILMDFKMKLLLCGEKRKPLRNNGGSIQHAVEQVICFYESHQGVR